MLRIRELNRPLSQRAGPWWRQVRARSGRLRADDSAAGISGRALG